MKYSLTCILLIVTLLSCAPKLKEARIIPPSNKKGSSIVIQTSPSIFETAKETATLLNNFETMLKNKDWIEIERIDSELSNYLLKHIEEYFALSNDTTLISAAKKIDSKELYKYDPKLNQKDRISYWKSNDETVIKLRIASKEFADRLSDLKDDIHGEETKSILFKNYTSFFEIYFGIK